MPRAGTPDAALDGPRRRRTGSSSPGPARRTTSRRPWRRRPGPSLHRPVIAVPLSELILRPEGVLVAATGADAAAGREPVVIISRSGSTSEAVSVAERMRAAGHPTIAVTCRGGSPLASLADATLVSPAGDEAAIVMTRSFASMLALLLGGRRAGRRRRRPDDRPRRGCAATGATRSRGRAGRTPPRSDGLEPDRRPRRRPGVRHRRRVGPQADRDEPGAHERLRAARVPARPDLGLRAGDAGRRPGGRRRRRPRKSPSSRRPRVSARTPG